MPQQQSPFLEGKYGWPYGSSGWNTGMDENLLKFSFMFDGNVDSIVASLPPVSNGAAHFNSVDNRFYFGIDSVWYSSPCPKSFIFKIKSNGDFYQFNGTSAVKIDNPSQIDSRLDAVELTLSSLGTAAFQNVEDFATQAELDIVEGQAQGYTDVLRNDLADNVDPAKGAGLVGYAGGTVSGVLATITTQLANAVYVVGDGTDQSAELSAALNSGNAVILKGDILLGSPVVSLAAFNIVTSEGASITYTGSAGSSGVLQFRPSVGLIVVGQLSIDCDNRAGYGLSCRPPSDGVRLVKIDGVSVSNCFAAAPSNSGAYGILVGVNGPGQIKCIAITNCEVIGVSRSLGDGVGGTCAGIAATDGITTVIVGNKISGVSVGNGSANADGVVVFSELVGSSYLPSNSLIQSNTITDCAGRMVKLQTRGVAVVEDNLMEVSNIALIPAWRGIDSQVADADIRHNKLTFTGAWSGGVDLSVFQVVSLVADFTGQASNSKVHDNIVNVRATATRIASGRVFMVAFTNLTTNAATATADIYNNQVTFEGGLNSATPACNLAFSVYVPDVWAPGATAAVKIRHNQVSATAFMERLGGTLNTDITGKLALLQISNNTLLSANSIPVLPWSSGDRYTSDLLVYGNSVGRLGGEVVAPFDYSRLKPGCQFTVGGGASSGYVNTPPSYNYSEVRHNGAFIVSDRGGTLYKTLFGPTPGATLTWTTYTL